MSFMPAAVQLGFAVLMMMSAMSATFAAAQTRKPAVPAKKPPAPAVAMTKIAPPITCPAPLGIGVKTKVEFCEVLAGRDPQAGVLIKLPSRRGPAKIGRASCRERGWRSGGGVRC